MPLHVIEGIKRPLLVWFDILVTLGSGVANIYSVIPLSHMHYHITQYLFPIRFLHLSAPLPLFLIQSGHDEYTPLDEAKKLFALAREPKRFVLVEAKNHRFDGNQEEFFQKLHEGLQWISQTG